MSIGKCNLDNLHFAVNDLYTDYDKGKINKVEALRVALKSCKKFIQENEREEDLPTFEVTQVEKVEHTWIVQAKNKEEAEDQAMTTDPDNTNELETLDLVVEEVNRTIEVVDDDDEEDEEELK